MADDDEFNAYDLSEFSEEDFARIDAELERRNLENNDFNSQGGPAVTIQVELPVIDVVREVSSSNVAMSSSSAEHTTLKHAERSPYQRFRRNNTLSVTDLVSPAWYELSIFLSE